MGRGAVERGEAMAELERLTVRIEADVSPLERSLANLQRSTDRQVASLRQVTDGILQRLQETRREETERQRQADAYLASLKAELQAVELTGEARREELAVLQARAQLGAAWSQELERNVRTLTRVRQQVDEQTAALERQHEEAKRIADRFTEGLVKGAQGLFEKLFEDSRSFWDDFASQGKSALAELAAEALVRGPATTFMQGLFGLETKNPGSFLDGLGGSIGQSAAGSAISEVLGLRSIGQSVGSALGLHGAVGLSAGSGTAATLMTFGDLAVAQSAISAGMSGGVFGGGGIMGLGAVGGPLALGALAAGGLAMLSGTFDKPSIGPNASARLGLDEARGRFVLTAANTDNGGETYLAQAEAGAVQALERLNALAARLGHGIDKQALQSIADPGLAVQFGERFRRGPEALIRDVLESGALGPLTAEQVQDALNGLDPLGRELQALRAALQEAGLGKAISAQEAALTEARKTIETFDRQLLRAQEELVAALRAGVEGFRQAAATLREAVAELRLSGLSPLAPGERLAEARRQFQAALASGDAAAAATSGRALLAEGVSFFGGGTAGASALFTEVVGTLEALADAGEREAVAGEARLRAAVAELDAMRAVEVITAGQAQAAAATAATAEAQLGELRRQSEALAAIEKALGQASPGTDALRAALDALLAGGGAGLPVTAALKAYVGALSVPAPTTNVVPLRSAGSPARPPTATFDMSPFLGAGGINMMGDGGVVARPTLAVIGERPGESEAVIPLKDGAVPVRISGGGAVAGELAAGNAVLRDELAGLREETRRLYRAVDRLLAGERVRAGGRQ